MEKEKTSMFTNALVWFGAAISISEILMGTFISPLGFKRGILSILLGHSIGIVLMFLVGLIGANTNKSSMETVKMSFGSKGSIFFSSLNVFQLIGWTAIMIISGAMAANSIVNLGVSIWSIIIGVLIIVWISIGLKNLNVLNIVAMIGLLFLAIILSLIVFKGNEGTIQSSDMTFGSAVELSVAMPLSWLPLVSDYTSKAKRKRASTLVTSIIYNVTSSWMYIIGLGIALYTSETDIGKIMMSSNLGVLGLIIIVFSTVTTTFLDAYSAGVSSISICNRLNERMIAILVCIIGTILAIFTPITRMEDFLYLIGSVFAPMIAIQIGNYLFIKEDSTNKNFNILNVILWAIGFITYRLFMKIDTILGNTVPVMMLVLILYIVINKIIGVNRNDRFNDEKFKTKGSTCS